MDKIKCVKADLPRDLTHVNLHVLADLHIGDKHCDEALIRRRIKDIADDPNAYCILNGDILNVAVKSSPSDIFAERMSPTDQLLYAKELFEPIQKKIVAITGGNHEFRTYKNDGVDLMQLLAVELDLDGSYSPEGIVVFLRFGAMSKNDKDASGQARKLCYVIYATHGSGGGRKEGAKAIRLADMASIVDADIYVHSHTHQSMVMKQAFFRTNRGASSATAEDRLFVMTGASLDYGGYAQSQEYKPASKETPIITMSGTKRWAEARL